MKYISLKSVVCAYSANRAQTKNKFWGLLSILSSLDSTVEPGVSYDFLTSRVATFLESLFSLDNSKKEYTNGSTWNIMLSNQWTSKVAEQMLSGTPNIYDVAVWFFRSTSFKDDVCESDLIALFLEKSHISIEDAKVMFNMSRKDVEFSDTLYTENELQKSLQINGTNITAEGASIVAHPGELSRAPFIQTLYAGQSTLECLIITPFRFGDYYQSVKQVSYNFRKDLSLQTIYFGSPGTGKSFKIKDEILNGVNDNYIFRTTFHPDTDYASFVGCYKPITTKNKQSSKEYTIEELADIYKREVGPTEHLNTGHIEPRIKFGIEYCEYFGGSAANYDANKMLEIAGIELATGCKEDRVGITYVKYGINVGLKIGTTKNTGTITYDFAPQTFTNAYVKAWQNPSESTYLVIEEINRGNCAQIFGDLFQLLDRNDDGVSEYPIKADADLTKYLQEVLGEDHEGITDGKIKLPANLYILATMNTSVQSLFPMDSAFKRRWEWQYVPTSVIGDQKKVLKVESKKETVLINKDQEQKVLRLGMYQYDWSLFLEKINKCITDATHSDDKQLGFWFVKTPKGSNEIKIETFVSKVIFYLWTDVFKDFGAKATNPFAFKNAEGGWVVCPFSSFFDSYTGEINLGSIHGFMYNLGIIPELEPDAATVAEESMQNPPADVE